jgi:hypothetical protein
MRVSIDQIATIKTCKSCKHYRYPLWVRMWAWATEGKPRCNRTAPNATIDVVSGKVRYPELDDSESCHRQRDSTYPSDCNPEAKHWLPKSKDGIFELIKHTDELNTK